MPARPSPPRKQGLEALVERELLVVHQARGGDGVRRVNGRLGDDGGAGGIDAIAHLEAAGAQLALVPLIGRIRVGVGVLAAV